MSLTDQEILDRVNLYARELYDAPRFESGERRQGPWLKCVTDLRLTRQVMWHNGRSPREMPITQEFRMLGILSRLTRVDYADASNIAAPQQGAFLNAVLDIAAARLKVPRAHVQRALGHLLALALNGVDLNINQSGATLSRVSGVNSGALRTALGAGADGNPTGAI